jgi:hypothetical protein
MLLVYFHFVCRNSNTNKEIVDKTLRNRFGFMFNRFESKELTETQKTGDMHFSGRLGGTK